MPAACGVYLLAMKVGCLREEPCVYDLWPQFIGFRLIPLNHDEHSNLYSLRFESLIPVNASKIGQVVKPVKFANNGATQPFVFDGGVSKSAGFRAFYVETSLRK
jgi:hypothetical protein